MIKNLMAAIKKILLSEIFYKVIRIMIGGIFLYSGWVKITDLSSFASVIYAFGLVPGEFRSIAALIISSAELIAGIGLIFDIKGSLTAIFSMMILFMLVLIYGIQMGFDIDCGCFGSDDPVGEAFHGLRSALVRDIFLILAVIYLYIWRKISTFEPYSLIFYYNRFVLTRAKNR